MRRHRRILEAFFTPFLLTTLLLIPACAGENSASGAPAGEDVEQEEPARALPDTEAGATLAAVMEEAGETDRLVFLHTGADW